VSKYSYPSREHVILILFSVSRASRKHGCKLFKLSKNLLTDRVGLFSMKDDIVGSRSVLVFHIFFDQRARFEGSRDVKTKQREPEPLDIKKEVDS
jgi:hypothetical protein